MTKFAILLLAALSLVATGAGAAEFKLTDGTSVKGEPVSFNETGMVLKVDDGSFSPRVPWFKLAPEVLKEFLQNPKAKPFVEPLIEVPVEEKQKAKRAEIVIKPVPRLERPAGISFGTVLKTPAGFIIALILFAANIFAAYEIAVFRNRSATLVCGVSAVAPVLGQLVFLAMPSVPRPEHLPAPIEEAPAEDPAHPPAPTPGIPDPGAHSPSGLTMAPSADDGEGGDLNFRQEYKRGEFSFNRRFFESKFPGFFRLVPSDAEKNLVLAVKAVRGEYVGRRIARITPNEMHLQLQAGDVSSEVMIPFVEILEVIVRHKDAQV